MALLKRIGLMLPVLRKTQACPVCGESFACEISLATGCWCNEIKLNDAARAELRAKYTGCLCRACLEKAAASEVQSQEPA